MTYLLWVLQALLAFHTATGAIWKFSATAAETMPALGFISTPVWMAMALIELVVAVLLILPVIKINFARYVYKAALFIVAEMLFYTGAYVMSGETAIGPVAYWLTVAIVAGTIAYGRKKWPIVS